jgi:ESCRT-II complex subunit VPS36
VPPPQTAQDNDGLFPCPRCTFLNHPALTACEICGEPLISPNLPPILASAEAIDRSISPAPFPAPPNEDRTYVRISFRAGGDKPFLERIRAAIVTKAWIPTTRTTEDITPTLAASSKTIGINGLEKASAALKLQNDRVLEASFQDLQALMARAKTLIALAEQLASKISNLPPTSGSEARRALRESSELLGLSTPIVTQEVAGGQEVYWGELAKQVAEFLTAAAVDGGMSLLKREGGIIPLIDLFALYNRARGVGIIPQP